MDRKVFWCRCNSNEHHVIVFYDPEEDWAVLSVHLTPIPNIWARIMLAIKYIFGYKSEYGHYAEIILDDSNISELQDILFQLKYKTKSLKKAAK